MLTFPITERNGLFQFKPSNNWKKAKIIVQKIHTNIANARKDFLHKTTTTISKNHALVCVEDLLVSNMSKSTKGSREQPGKKVRQKAGLNRNILDQGWGIFRSQLEYKMEWNGGMLRLLARGEMVVVSRSKKQEPPK